MFEIKQAVIVAGGKGTRLGKLASKLPKPLIKINDKPFLEYLIEFLIRNSIKEIIILAGFKGTKIIKLFKYSKDIKVLLEKKPLGTGGSLVSNLRRFDKKFVFLNGDSFFNINLKREINLCNKIKNNVMFLVENKNYKSNTQLSSLKINKKKNLSFSKKSSLMYSGISILNKKDLLNFKKKEFLSFETNIIPELIEKSKVNGKIKNNFFIDIGTKKNLLYAKQYFKYRTRKKCFFFDRDNTLIFDKGYTFKTKDLKWKPGAIKAIKLLNELDYLVIIITNQSGVARKYYTENDVVKFHEHMNNNLKRHKAIIDDFFYCPFHKNGFGKYKKNSIDRKPNNGMVIKAIKKWNIDITNSFFIGDKQIDQITAKKSKIKFYKSNKNLFFRVRDIIKKNAKLN